MSNEWTEEQILASNRAVIAGRKGTQPPAAAKKKPRRKKPAASATIFILPSVHFEQVAEALWRRKGGPGLYG